MTTTKTTKAQKFYGIIQTSEKYAGIRWIANVLFTSCGQRAHRLAALIKLVDDGHDVGTASFKMPYECLLVDGRAVVAMPLLDRGEMISYDENWWKHE